MIPRYFSHSFNISVNISVNAFFVCLVSKINKIPFDFFFPIFRLGRLSFSGITQILFSRNLTKQNLNM